MALVLIFISFFSLWTSSSLATPFDEKAIRGLFSTEVADFVVAHKTDRFYQGVGNTKNYYAAFLLSSGSIENPLIIVTGAEDPVPAWFRLVYRAASHGYQKIYVVEIRGQGQSERVPGNSKKALHVLTFENYYQDYISGLKDIHSSHPFEKPVHVLSHSTGSAIVLNSLDRLEKELPSFRMAAHTMWTPLVLLELSPWLDNVIMRPVLDAAEGLLAKLGVLMIARPYGPTEFEKNKITNSREQYAFYEKLKNKYEMGSSGASLRWGIEALRATKELRENFLSRLENPTLILKVDDEKVVSNKFKFSSENAKEVTLSNSKHALNIESEEVFQQAFETTIDFFKKTSSADPKTQ